MSHSPMTVEQYLDLVQRYGAEFRRGAKDQLAGTYNPPKSKRSNARFYYLMGQAQVKIGRITGQIIEEAESSTG